VVNDSGQDTAKNAHRRGGRLAYRNEAVVYALGQRLCELYELNE
jgi:hypothetical protein